MMTGLLLAGICLFAQPVDIGSRFGAHGGRLLYRAHVGRRGASVAPSDSARGGHCPRQAVEGSMCDYHTVFQDGDKFRMYLHLVRPGGVAGRRHARFAPVVLRLRGKQGRHSLGEAESWAVRVQWVEGEQHCLAGEGAHDFDPFIDVNPACKPEAKYKCVAMAKGALWAFQSADAIHWSAMAKNPIITKGAFDTQNIAFWDAVNKTYRAYLRDFHNGRARYPYVDLAGFRDLDRAGHARISRRA